MKKWIVWVAWEYFVAAELSQRGIIATLTLKNTPSIDILATNLETGKFANIQVKTMSIENNQGWRLWEKDEKNSKIKNHFYILVNLQWESKIPEYYVFHQKILATYIRKGHKKRLNWDKNRKDNTFRVFDPYRRKDVKKFADKYRDKWELLELE